MSLQKSIGKLVQNYAKLYFYQSGMGIIEDKFVEMKLEMERKLRDLSINFFRLAILLIFLSITVIFIFVSIFFYLSGDSNHGVASLMTGGVAILVGLLFFGISYFIK